MDEHGAPLDIVYLFRHSPHNDQEIRYSLRSVAKHLPYIRKVWIFGDRPAFLADDKSCIEHVPHGYIAPLFGWQTPVRNELLMLFLASLIPELSFDFVRFSDDYIVLTPLTRSQLCTTRALEDLDQLAVRGRGPFKEMLWRTHDILQHFGYSAINFECHVPQPFTRKLVFEAYMAFRDFVTEDRHQGVLATTTLKNYAIKHFGRQYIWLKEEQSRAGFYGAFPTAAEIGDQCQGKLFLNFDDRAFGPAMIEFLNAQFPSPCGYER